MREDASVPVCSALEKTLFRQFERKSAFLVVACGIVAGCCGLLLLSSHHPHAFEFEQPTLAHQPTPPAHRQPLPRSPRSHHPSAALSPPAAPSAPASRVTSSTYTSCTAPHSSSTSPASHRHHGRRAPPAAARAEGAAHAAAARGRGRAHAKLLGEHWHHVHVIPEKRKEESS